MHAASYFMIGYRFMWFKVYRTGYSFADFFNSLADDLPNFDYENGMEIRTNEQFEHFLNFYIPKTSNDQARKKQTLMANMLFEANLFGIKLEKASVHSKPNLFFYEEKENTIYMPLTSLPGISGEATLIREILDSVDLSEISLEKLMKIKVDSFTEKGKPVKKGLKKNYITALKLEEYYIKKGYMLKEPSLFDLI